MKKHFLFLAALCLPALVLLLLPEQAFAADEDFVSTLVREFYNKTSTWEPTLKRYALDVYKRQAYVSGVAAAVAQLTDSFSSASVEGIRKVFDAHATRLQAFKNSTAWLAAIVGVSALLNVAVFVLGGLR